MSWFWPWSNPKDKPVAAPPEPAPLLRVLALPAPAPEDAGRFHGDIVLNVRGRPQYVEPFGTYSRLAINSVAAANKGNAMNMNAPLKYTDADGNLHIFEGLQDFIEKVGLETVDKYNRNKKRNIKVKVPVCRPGTIQFADPNKPCYMTPRIFCEILKLGGQAVFVDAVEAPGWCEGLLAPPPPSRDPVQEAANAEKMLAAKRERVALLEREMANNNLLQLIKKQGNKVTGDSYWEPIDDGTNTGVDIIPVDVKLQILENLERDPRGTIAFFSLYIKRLDVSLYLDLLKHNNKIAFNLNSWIISANIDEATMDLITQAYDENKYDVIQGILDSKVPEINAALERQRIERENINKPDVLINNYKPGEVKVEVDPPPAAPSYRPLPSASYTPLPTYLPSPSFTPTFLPSSSFTPTPVPSFLPSPSFAPRSQPGFLPAPAPVNNINSSRFLASLGTAAALGLSRRFTRGRRPQRPARKTKNNAAARNAAARNAAARNAAVRNAAARNAATRNAAAPVPAPAPAIAEQNGEELLDDGIIISNMSDANAAAINAARNAAAADEMQKEIDKLKLELEEIRRQAPNAAAAGEESHDNSTPTNNNSVANAAALANRAAANARRNAAERNAAIARAVNGAQAAAAARAANEANVDEAIAAANAAEPNAAEPNAAARNAAAAAERNAAARNAAARNAAARNAAAAAERNAAARNAAAAAERNAAARNAAARNAAAAAERNAAARNAARALANIRTASAVAAKIPNYQPAPRRTMANRIRNMIGLRRQPRRQLAPAEPGCVPGVDIGCSGFMGGRKIRRTRKHR
jgi:hypothetical protein